MNIFILDRNPKLATQYHVDKHVVKMCLETAQILSTTQNLCGVKSLYKPTHKNHPCCKWARESLENYIWLCEFAYELCLEYTYRYNKIHKSQRVIEYCMNNIPTLPSIEQTPFALAMPDECKCECPVKSYRKYYNIYKKHLYTWTKREIPYWVEYKKDEEKI